MCGIVGYIGRRKAAPILLGGLKRLEYRGYDSAGVAVIENGDIRLVRSEGKIARLEELLAEDELEGSCGVGHTRWATHGRPSTTNAHPHKAGKIVLVHNGIIENHRALRAELEQKGHSIKSETDTEIAAHLIQQFTFEGRDFVEAVRLAVNKIEGSSAIVVLDRDSPDLMIGARVGSPLVAGVGDDEQYLASDVPAIMDQTRDVIFLEDHEMAVVSRDGIRILDFDGNPVRREPRRIDWTPTMAEKGFYKHFMLKEIHEQPRAVADTLSGRVSPGSGRVNLDNIGEDLTFPETLGRIIIVACGTSYHAGLTGKFMLEAAARLPVEVDLASEFRYRDPLIGEGDLLVLISQSGETADTLAALDEGRSKGAKILTVCNVMDSTMARKSDYILYTHAGPEIGVAATKTFMAQLAALSMLSLYLAEKRGTLPKEKLVAGVDELVRLPHYLESALNCEERIKELAEKYHRAQDFLFLGRGPNYPIALEGALKLKEISYIHAEGYAAGEMKHGPIALIDENMPVVVLVTPGKHYDRNGKVIAVAMENDEEVARHADDIVVLPHAPLSLLPYLITVPLQLLAYHIAVLRGTDVDQPRNLAKSVTVE